MIQMTNLISSTKVYMVKIYINFFEINCQMLYIIVLVIQLLLLLLLYFKKYANNETNIVYKNLFSFDPKANFTVKM